MALIIDTKMPECCDKCFLVPRCPAHARKVSQLLESKNENQIFDVFGETRLEDCIILGEVNPDSFKRVVITTGDGTAIGYKDIFAKDFMKIGGTDSNNPFPMVEINTEDTK